MMRIISFTLPIIALLAVAAILGWGVQDTTVTSYTITGASIQDGLVIEGIIGLENPSRLPVPINKVTYSVTTSGGEIATGQLDGWLLTPGESETRIDIELTSQSVLSAIRTTDTRVEVTGEVHLPLIPAIPFSDEYDLTSAISDPLEQMRDAVGGLV